MKRHSTSPPCGNQVDGLPHDVHTETVAKPGRLGPAQNDELTQKNVELARFCMMDEKNSPRTFCPKYIEDSDKCIKVQKK